MGGRRVAYFITIIIVGLIVMIMGMLVGRRRGRGIGTQFTMTMMLLLHYIFHHHGRAFYLDVSFQV
eukprot:11708604-Ditylum_brightwellii.AAC.1